ncbi:hypothetical protein [Catellatospora sichuanensis]|uniref:hypothetical protein n=1 Tax=Catellatospora sichuanensis TaxID=1969805 RepID=UPI001183910D|nr:hypothetical protein [Catellatospora sichuanensis]
MTGMEIAALIWGSVATIGAVSAAFVKWRATSDETTSALWRDEAAAWKAKAERLEAALNTLEKRVDALESENKILRSMHDTREELAAMRTAMADGFSSLREIMSIEGK